MKEERENLTLKELFIPRLDQWGYRGDPYLWDDIQRELQDKPLPGSVDELADVLVHVFRRLVGVDLALLERKYLEEYSYGGISSGMVSGQFWRERGFPILLDRFRSLRDEDLATQDFSGVEFVKIK
ncbi:hypothetical protein [Roseicyclus elongatus]|uniref:hypothetical protein n=1 Tax=Roseicyclus elongatus TaxID=159346 RepID=UPI0012ECB8CA|nr:hypothetical protein [Roseibacterium elongatum]